MKLNKLQILSTVRGEILVPNYFDYETNYKIYSAVASVTLSKSVDTFLKEFPIDKEIKKEQTSTEQITTEIQFQLDAIYAKHKKINYSEDNIRTFGVHTSLSRLKHSYEVCIFLINLGFYFEANTIIRLIFEQLVFCTNIADVTNEEYAKLKPGDLSLSSTKIGKLENIVSDIEIGKFYGDLSNRAHININEVGKYLEYDDEIKQVMIVERSQNLTLVSAILLLTVSYIHQIVLEYSFKEFITEFEHLERINGGYKSIPNIEFRKKIDMYHNLV